MKISIHRALAELKLLESKMSRAANSVFVLPVKGNSNISGKSQSDTANEITANLQSVMDLYDNFRKLKAAIIQSNAVTKVVVNSDVYTVAELIALKSTISSKEQLLNAMKGQLYNARSKVESENNNLQKQLESYLVSVLGQAGSRKPEDVKSMTEMYYKQNEWKLLDPVTLSAQIEKLEQDIEAFKTNVDYVLSESNASTYIDV